MSVDELPSCKDCRFGSRSIFDLVIDSDLKGWGFAHCMHPKAVIVTELPVHLGSRRMHYRKDEKAIAENVLDDAMRIR